MSASVAGVSVAPATPSSARVRRDDRDQCESRCTTEQELLVADPVAEAAHADQQGSEDERVDVADPEDLREAGVEVLADERCRQRQHGAIDTDQEDGQGKDAEG
jgi:hypothetical protein